MVKTKKILAGFGWVGLVLYINRALGFVTTLILAKYLAPEEFGQVAVAVMIIEVLKIFKDMGFGQALIYQKDRMEEAANTAFYMMVGLNLILFLIAVIMAPFAAAFFENADLTLVIMVMSSNLIFISIRGVPDALIRKEVDFHKLIVPDIAPVLLASIVSILMAVNDYGVWSLAVRSLVATSLAAILIWRYTSFRPKLQFDIEMAKILFNYGKYVVGASIVIILSYNVDNLIISKAIGIEALGIYTLAAAIAYMPVTEFAHLICRVMFPVFSKLNQDLPALTKMFVRAISYSSLISIPMAIGLAVYGPDVTKIFLDPKWDEIAIPLQVISLCAVFRSLSSVIHESLRAIGLPKQVQRFVLLRLIIISTLGIPAAVLYGLPGMCFLVLFSFMVVFVWEIKSVCTQLEVGVLELVKNFLMPVMLAVTIIPSTYFLFGINGTGQQIMMIVMGILSSIVFYFLAIYLLDKKTVMEIQAIVSKKNV